MSACFIIASLFLILSIGLDIVGSESCTYKFVFRATGKCMDDRHTCKYQIPDHLRALYDEESLQRENHHECEQGRSTCVLTPTQKGVPGTCVGEVCKANNGQGKQWTKTCQCAKCKRDCVSADLATKECVYERFWQKTGVCIKWEVPKCKFTPLERERHLYDEESLTKDVAWECADGRSTCRMNPKYKKVDGTCKSDKCHPHGLKRAPPKYNVGCLCQLCLNHGCLVKNEK